ncbi:MAG: hypothetical protein JWP68_3222 [Modestobacter sp.]|nr:hypothetical protein [Modestobacter sp.]
MAPKAKTTKIGPAGRQRKLSLAREPAAASSPAPTTASQGRAAPVVVTQAAKPTLSTGLLPPRGWVRIRIRCGSPRPYTDAKAPNTANKARSVRSTASSTAAAPRPTPRPGLQAGDFRGAVPPPAGGRLMVVKMVVNPGPVSGRCVSRLTTLRGAGSATTSCSAQPGER